MPECDWAAGTGCDWLSFQRHDSPSIYFPGEENLKQEGVGEI
jgi:hypothetical protein